MRTLLSALVSFILASSWGCSAPADRESASESEDASTGARIIEDPDLRRIHSRMLEAMAPEGGWERARYIRFDRVEEGRTSTHAWDRITGEYRLEVPGEGGALVALFDRGDTTTGRAWIDGTELEGAVATRALDEARRISAADSWWLLMPYLWTEPEMEARFLGERTDSAGKRWEVVELTTDEEEDIPAERHLAFVNPETGLIERSEHFALSADSEPALVTEWTEWRQFGPIRLATERGPVSFRRIEVRDRSPRGAFEPPGSASRDAPP